VRGETRLFAVSSRFSSFLFGVCLSASFFGGTVTALQRFALLDVKFTGDLHVRIDDDSMVVF
jgi:hypothetical protein